jgi:hypothetical protein
VTTGGQTPDQAPEPRRASVQYPGGLAARYRWTGSGGIAALVSVSEAGGTLTDHGPIVAADPDRLCRAELRVEGPSGTWTARFASPIHDEPRGVFLDTAGLLVVKYGFLVYGMDARTGALRWHHASRTPVIAVLGSSRLPHVVAQGEIATIALDAAGETVWRAAHADVITEAEIVGGRLVLATWGGLHLVLDPATGRSLDG